MKRIKPLLRERQPGQEIPRQAQFLARPSLEKLFAGVREKEERNLRIFRAAVEQGYALAEAGEPLGLHCSTISRIVGRLSQK